MFLIGLGNATTIVSDETDSSTSHWAIDFRSGTDTKAVFRKSPTNGHSPPNDGYGISCFQSEARKLNRHLLNWKMSFIISHLRDSRIARGQMTARAK